jgi:WhiB family redox-sensing transcriptional regulator
MSAAPGHPQARHTPGFTRDNLGWRDRASCTQIEPEMFFPKKGERNNRQAKKICLGCEVKRQCLQFALDHDERYGIWGGKGETERRKLRRQRCAS